MAPQDMNGSLPRPDIDRQASGFTIPQISPPGQGLVIFSGGTAANSLVDVFEHVRAANKCSLSYVIPISDNGGSTSEVIRVFGGPGRSVLSATCCQQALKNLRSSFSMECRLLA